MPVSVLEKVRQADNLPTLPTVAVEVLRLTQADDISVADIARVIQQDPALTSKILRVVNSSLFGMSRRISSLQQATVVLGLRTVKVMVLSFSLVDEFRNQQGKGFDYAMYWRRSLTTAVIARQLAEVICRDMSDECFVAGLLCDIGILAAAQCAREEYKPVIIGYSAGTDTIQRVEERELGLTHEVISHDLLSHWGLPEGMCASVHTHHQPMTAPCASDAATQHLTRILRAAAMLADLFVADTYAQHLKTIHAQVAGTLPIAEQDLTRLLEAVDGRVKETASLFELNIGQTYSYQEIQMAAMTQLAKLSMAAELERAQVAKREVEALARVEELSDRNRELAQQAATDALTGIGNRGSLEEHLVRMCEQVKKTGQSIGLLLLDLDRFKKLNDTFGHPVGDEALRQVGGVLKQMITDTQFAARYGGEEFSLCVMQVSARELRLLAEELRLAIAKLRIPAGPRQISITVSVGACHATADDPGICPRELVRRADQCLYEAKNTGRNRVVCVDTRQIAAQAAQSGVATPANP